MLSKPAAAMLIAVYDVLKSIRVQLTPEVALRNTFLHTSKSHSAAPGMHAYSARELRAKMHVVTSALLLFTLHFLSWWSSQSNPKKLK